MGGYQEKTETVLAGAERNAAFYADEARKNFWRATGYGPMRHPAVLQTGIIRERGINPRARKMWSDFNEAFATPVEKTKARNKYKKQLLGNLALMGAETSQDQGQQAA